MRTTLDIDGSVLNEFKAYQRGRGKPLGAVASELLAKALAEAGEARAERPFTWTAVPMGGRVDLEDHDALGRLMGEEYPSIP